MLLERPVSDHRDDGQLFRRFAVWLNVLLVGAALVILVSAVLGAPGEWKRYLMLLMVVVTAVVSLTQVTRHPRRALSVIVVGIWVMSTATVLVFAGVHSAVMVVYPFVIGLAGWAMGRRWVIGFAVATIVLIAGVGLAEVWGLYQPTGRAHPMVAAVQICAVMVVIAFLTIAARHNLALSRDQALALSKALQQQVAEVAQNERQLELLLDNVPAAVASFDAHSRLRSCNQRYADLFAVHPHDIIGKVIENYLPPLVLEQIQSNWAKALAGERQAYRRFNVDPKTSALTWLDGVIKPEYEGQRIVGLYVMLTDVTDKVQSEAEIKNLNSELEMRVTRRTNELALAMEKLHESREELVRSQAKATLAALVASVSHELGTPIGNSVLVASSLQDLARELQNQLDTNQLKKSTLTELNRTLGEGSNLLLRNLKRAEGLLQNFKQVSADQVSEQRRNFDLAAMVGEVVASLAPSLKTQPHRIIQDMPMGIVMDSFPGPLGQVVINLINNAYMHAFEGRSDGVLRIAAVVSEAEVTLRFEDNGVGISGETLVHLFEPFFSTKIGRGGTGLGMSIVESIVRQTLGGTMQVASVVGQGTTMSVTLPMVAPEPAATLPAAPLATPPEIASGLPRQ